MAEKMLQVRLMKPRELVVGQAEKPSAGPGQILIKVLRCGVCGSDITIFHGLHPYVSYPLVMGHEFSGTVAELGEGVDGPAVGTRVAVIPHLVCGECEPCRTETYNFCEQLRCTGAEADGAHCQYIAMPHQMVLPIPERMSLEDAAMIEPISVGYHGAKRGEIRPGDVALVVGAGPIGIFTMQSAKCLGAGRVIIADLDGWRLDLAASLGADGVIDVSKETLEAGLIRLLGDVKKVDVFYDCVGEKGFVFDQILQMARRGSRTVIIGVLQKEYTIPHLPDFVQHELRLSGTTMYTPQDYREVIALLDSGQIRTDGLITHTFNLSEIVSVFDMIEQGKEKFFKIMFTVNDEESQA
jgi:L-iditol 2-dehydrogenase